MKIIKASVAACFLIFGVQIAQAQESSQPKNSAPIPSKIDGAPRSDRQARTSDMSYPSGFNAGPTKFDVPGCVGPVSYCNIYFGS